MKFPEKLFVGIEDREPLNPENPSLGFATPWGTDAAFKKRRETVINWVGGNSVFDKNTQGYVTVDGKYEGHIIDNDPTEGFTFEKSVSRWSTSNKWFTINDPRGFQLQISAENLGYVILSQSIEKGKILGKFVWGRDGAVNYLCGIDHEEYVLFKNPVVAPKSRPLKAGDKVRFGFHQDGVVYVGNYFAALMGNMHRYVQYSTGRILDEKDADFRALTYHVRNYWGNLPKTLQSVEQRYISYVKRDLTSWHVFKIAKNYQGAEFLLTRKPSNYQILEENCEFELPSTGKSIPIDISTHDQIAQLFLTKQEMLGAIIPPEETQRVLRYGSNYYKHLII